MAKKPSLRSLQQYWWEKEEGRRHEVIGPIVKHLKQSQALRSSRNLLHMRLYGNMDIAGMSNRDYFIDSSPGPNNKVKLNVCKDVVDTVVSKLAKNRPRPMFLTDGGNFAKKQKAKRLNKYMEGAFQGMKIYDKGPAMVRDAGVFDLGALKFYTKDDKVCCERAMPEELYVDEQEGMYGDPRSLFQVKALSREVMLAEFEDFEDEILKADRVTGNSAAKSMTDLIEVIEAWHLPSSKDATDGLHTITIKNCDLFAEQFDIPMFPFVFFRWSDRLVGWYGQGIIEQLVPIQIEINKTLRTIQEAIKWSVPKVLVAAGTKVTTMSNLIMGHWKYTGQKPDIEAFDTVPKVLFEHLTFLYQKAFEIIGVSQLSAQSQKPSGLNSGRALREFTDIESDRFVVDGQRYEQSYLDAGRLTLSLTKKLAEDNPGLKVKYQDRKGAQVIAWKDVAMSENEFEMTMWPTNLLPKTPAGRLATVQEMMETGLIGPEDGKRLLDYPDIESVTSLTNSPIEILDMIIEKLMDGEYIPPEPYFDLAFGVKRMQQAYLKARMDNADEDTLELMRRWIDQAAEMLNPPTDDTTAPAPGGVPEDPLPVEPPGAPPPMMPPGVPPGMPMQ